MQSTSMKVLSVFGEELYFSREREKRGRIQRWGWWMCWWWHFDRGNFDLTGRRLSHESKCVSRALEMEGHSLWLWHPCEGLRLLGVKCDTSLGRCWFSVAAAQQTSSHGVWRGVWARGWGKHRAPDREWGPTALHPRGRHLTACKSRTYAAQHPTPSLIIPTSLFWGISLTTKELSVLIVYERYLKLVFLDFFFYERRALWFGQFSPSVNPTLLTE